MANRSWRKKSNEQAIINVIITLKHDEDENASEHRTHTQTSRWWPFLIVLDGRRSHFRIWFSMFFGNFAINYSHTHIHEHRRIEKCTWNCGGKNNWNSTAATFQLFFVVSRNIFLLLCRFSFRLVACLLALFAFSVLLSTLLFAHFFFSSDSVSTTFQMLILLKIRSTPIRFGAFPDAGTLASVLKQFFLITLHFKLPFNAKF